MCALRICKSALKSRITVATTTVKAKYCLIYGSARSLLDVKSNLKLLR